MLLKHYSKLLTVKGNIISSKEGVWFDLRYGDAPFIFSTNTPRAELEKFTPNPITEQTFLNQLKGSDKPSPFTSKVIHSVKRIVKL